MNLYKKELFRKSIHICTAFVPVLLKFWYWPCIVLLVLALILYLISEILRLKGIRVPVVAFITETASRERDEGKIVLGPVMLVLGVLTAALILPFTAACVGILALAFGDGLASLVGKLIGRVKIPFCGGKTLEGSLACFLAVFTTILIVSKSFLISLIVAFVTAIIELLPLGDFDNLIIPISSGGLFLLLCTIFCYSV